MRRSGKKRDESLARRGRGSFAPKTIRSAPPSAPQRAGFGLGPPAPISARVGEKWALGGATGPIFRRWGPKSRLGGLVGGAAGDALIFPEIRNSDWAEIWTRFLSGYWLSCGERR